MDALALDAQRLGLKKFGNDTEIENALRIVGAGDCQRPELGAGWSTVGDFNVRSNKKGECQNKNVDDGRDDVLAEDVAKVPSNGNISPSYGRETCSAQESPSKLDLMQALKSMGEASSYHVLAIDELDDRDRMCDNISADVEDTLRPETDVFNGDASDLSSLETDKNGNIVGKRNRQISTDSSGSAANEAASVRKASKKARNRVRRRTQDEDEIDRILAELDTDSVKQTVPNAKDPPSDTQPETIANLEIVTNKQSKKKRKNRKRPAQKVNMPGSNWDNQQTSDGHSPEVIDTVSGSDMLCLVLPSTEGAIAVDHAATDAPVKSEGKGDAKKERKKPSKRQLEAIHDALRRAKEEEEKCQQEMRARQKKLEEAERLRLEALRLEQERKERKKQKSKDKKDRLKAQGKLLTKSQKLAKAKVQAAISAWREHGIDVPLVGDKKAEPKKLPSKTRTRHRTMTESDAEPCSLMSASSISTDTEDHFTWECLATAHSDGETSLSAKQRHSSDPEQAGSKAPLLLRQSSEHGIPELPHDPHRMRAKSFVEIRSKASDKTENDLAKIRKRSESGKELSRISLRSPVVCVLGHVDTGKTKILDKIRKTHVQDGEAGGITQQIGATMIPGDAIREKCRMVKSFPDFALEIPGLLVIDTPGHESFRNLRSRGSSLCDIAILVIDIMHGLEQQTLESIDLLKQRKTPFVVALNKVDRLYGWESSITEDIETIVKKQGLTTTMEFDKKCNQIIAELAAQSLNASLFYKNPDPRTYISMVPVSAITGDGMGNLLATVAQLCQTMMYKNLVFCDELKATVLEVKTIAGLGTTIDVILVNGHLHEGDTIVVAGQDGPIVTQIRSILMPQPLRELRVKNPYQEYKVVKGAQGVKLCGKDLDKAIAGLPLFVAGRNDSIPDLKEKMTRLFRITINSIKLSERGVYVQASTLGSLEALLEYLKSSGIPYAGVKVGPVVKKDVIRASVMLEHDIQYAAILAFDVKIERDAQDLADHLGIKVFQADIIYHLFDRYVQFQDELAEKKRSDLKKFYVLPCKLAILPDCVLNIRDPIVIGVRVLAGVLKVGTPLCVPSKKSADLGTVASIRVGNQSLDSAKEGDEVCVKIEPSDQAPKTYGKHFDQDDVLVSKISRQTIDVCKEYYRDDLRKSDWQLMVELKKLLLIV